MQNINLDQELNKVDSKDVFEITIIFKDKTFTTKRINGIFIFTGTMLSIYNDKKVSMVQVNKNEKFFLIAFMNKPESFTEEIKKIIDVSSSYDEKDNIMKEKHDRDKSNI